MDNYDNNYEDYNHDDANLSPYAAQRRLAKNQMERKVRQSQMWLARFRRMTRFFIILLMIFVGYKLLRLHPWYLDKNVFNSVNNPNLEILNNKIVPSYKLLSALRRTEVPHTPIYRMETDDIRNDLMKIDPIKNVYVRRFWWPARLQIIVEERVPVITISPDPKVQPIAFFAEGGKLIGRDYMPLPKSFKTILVLSYGAKGDDYRNWNNEKISLLVRLAKAVEENAKEPVEYIDCRAPKDIYVKLKSANIRLGELDESIFERVQRIPSILPQIKTLDKTIKYIDLRWKDANYIKLG